MKKFILFVSFLIVANAATFAQLSLSLGEIIPALDDMELFVQNRQLKDRAETMAQSAGNMPAGLSQAKYDSVKYHYSQLAWLYNTGYLSKIKTDLSKFSAIKEMVKKPEDFTQRYFDGYRRVVEYFNGPYSRQIGKIGASNQDPGTIITLGITAIVKIVDLIKARKEERGEIVEGLLSQLNSGLFKRIEMKPWDALGIPGPVTATGESGLKLNTLVPPAATNTATGKVTLLPYYDGKARITMPLQVGGSAITRSFMLNNSDQVSGIPPSLQLQAEQFEVEGRYGHGTYYQIQVECSGLVYAFALNNGRTTYGFYPHVGELSAIPYGTSFDNSGAREMVVSKPGATNDRAIMMPDATNYVQIRDLPGQPVPEAEWLVILVCKSELDMHDVMAKMEAASPSLGVSQRLTLIYGDQLATAKEGEVRFEAGSLLFNLDAADKNILPLVIKVPRQ